MFPLFIQSLGKLLINYFQLFVERFPNKLYFLPSFSDCFNFPNTHENHTVASEDCMVDVLRLPIANAPADLELYKLHGVEQCHAAEWHNLWAFRNVYYWSSLVNIWSQYRSALILTPVSLKSTITFSGEGWCRHFFAFRDCECFHNRHQRQFGLKRDWLVVDSKTDNDKTMSYGMDSSYGNTQHLRKFSNFETVDMTICACRSV